MSGRTNALIDALEPRRLFAGQVPLGINFNDEAMWDANFATVAQEAKTLGVQSVRLWFGFNDYDVRPNAWDPSPAFGTVLPGETIPSVPRQNRLQQSMRRAFDLKKLGFKVLAVLSPDEGKVPDSAADVRGLVRHLMNASDSPGSSFTLADAVDGWEIGNETDSVTFWKPSGSNKTSGLKSYVNQFLIPASQELHSGPASQWERVLSAGVSYSPADLKVILDELKAKGALSAIDSAGFHPYGNYSPSNPSSNVIRSNSKLAAGYAAAVGKTITATEWNVRGFGTSGSNNATWARAIDEVYRTAIQPYFDTGYYFALINNWAGRGGTVSARPGGVLKHLSNLSVVPSSPIPQLQAYYESSTTRAEPFYSVVKSWQYGTVSGRVVNTTGATAPPTTKVWIDVDGNGQAGATEPATFTDASGAYTLQYSVRDVAPGSYSVRIAAPGGWAAVTGSITHALTNLTAATGVNFSVQTGTTPPNPSAIGVLSGVLWQDDQNLPAVGWRVFIDVNANGVFDDLEPSALTRSTGAYTITYDTRLTGSGVARVRPVLPSGYLTSTSAPSVVLTGGTTQSGFSIGVRRGNTPGGTPGSISGYLWNDSAANGIFDGLDSRSGSRVVYIDTDGDNQLDSGERQTTSDANGNYRFDNVAAGTYFVTRVFPSGYRISNGANGHLTVTVATGQSVVGANIGSTNLRSSTPTPTPTPNPTPTPDPTPTPAPPTTGGASIAGRVLAQVNKWNAAAAATTWRPYLDTDKDGRRDAGEVYATATTDGLFKLSGLAAGTYTLALEAASGWKVVTPSAKTFTITLKATTAKTGQNFVVAMV